MTLLGYSRVRRSAFWQFVHGNQVPLIRVGRKKINNLEKLAVASETPIL
jgi:hypothetical protein